MDDIILKIITTIIGIVVTGLIGWLGTQIAKYKKLVKKEEDETIKSTLIKILSEHLDPIRTDISNLKNDVKNIWVDVASLQKFETNFQTRLDPVQEELEQMKDDIAIVLQGLKDQGIDLSNIKEKENLLEEKTRCAWRYRIRTLCLAYIKRGYMTHEEFAQLQEMFNIYEALGGNGQTKELYNKTIQLEIHAE